MNLDHLQKKLLTAARSHLPSEHVPYAFEKRILALLAGSPPLDHWAVWARALWRASAPCVALTILLVVWSLVGAKNPTAGQVVSTSEDFSQHFEQTMLAGVNDVEEVW